jgi:hypothetical protein
LGPIVAAGGRQFSQSRARKRGGASRGRGSTGGNVWWMRGIRGRRRELFVEVPRTASCESPLSSKAEPWWIGGRTARRKVTFRYLNVLH